MKTKDEQAQKAEVRAEEFDGDTGKEAAGRKGRIMLIAAAAVALVIALIYIFGGRTLWSRLYTFFGLTEDLPAPRENAASVYFLDVGQGDSSLILADGRSILIDSGEYDKAGKVISALRTLGVERLDYVIATHPHSDHIGAMAEVISVVPSGMLIMPDTESVTGSYKGAVFEAERTKAEIRKISGDETIDLGGSGSLHIFRSQNDLVNLNNNSLVVKFVYGDTSFLFCGDIELEAEEYLLGNGADIDSDVIKVPHHGSNTSNDRAFVEKVSPGYAVISVGESNDYGHPHKAVLRLYELLGAEIHRTDKEGSIAVFSDGESVTFAA